MNKKKTTFRYYLTAYTFTDAYNLTDYAIKKKVLTAAETFGVDGKALFALARKRLKKAGLLKEGMAKLAQKKAEKLEEEKQKKEARNEKD